MPPETQNEITRPTKIEPWAIVTELLRNAPSVIPAQAGIQYLRGAWIPAFAGMTLLGRLVSHFARVYFFAKTYDEIIIFWILEVPSTIWKDLASRSRRSTGYSLENP